MQPDASHTHQHSHTLTRDRRYRARFSYKFPKGKHQTPPVVWRSPPLFPHPLLLSPLLITLVLSLSHTESSSPLLSFFDLFLYSPLLLNYLASLSYSTLPFQSLTSFKKCVWWPLWVSHVNVCVGQSSWLWIVWLHACGATRLRSSSQDRWAMRRVMTHTTSCIQTPNTHKHRHSHRLGPSTRSHSLGLRGLREHGQSWHKLCVCVWVCECMCGAMCQGLYLQSVDLSL